MAYFRDGLRRKIVVALGLTPLVLASQPGCAVRSLDGPDDGGDDDADDDDDDGSTSADPTTGSSYSGSGDGPTVTTTTTVGSSEDDGTVPPVQTCWLSDDWLEWELWMPLGPGGQCVCDEACQALAQAQWDEENCCGSCWYSFGDVLCAEPLGDQCHYIVTMFEEGCGKGRPLLVGDQARTAEPCHRGDWAEVLASPGVEALAVAHRRALAEHWTSVALAEHASVASFARFVLDLSALGAPPSLLAEAATAMQDEIRHAQVAFGLAGAYAEHPIGPGVIPMEGVVAGGDPEAIVRAAVREGCIEETLAAAEAELAARRATDPAVRAALASIAEDEARHAVLAWRFVDWALRRDPSLAAVVRDELRRACDAAHVAGSLADDLEGLPAPEGLPAEVASAHGVLPPAVRHRLRACCLRDTVRPCAAAMLHDRGREGSPAPRS